jgi:hypothetical protein
MVRKLKKLDGGPAVRGEMRIREWSLKSLVYVNRGESVVLLKPDLGQGIKIV